ncbi:MAG: Sip1-related alpha-galactosidase [Rikenellaceae bacterium]
MKRLIISLFTAATFISCSSYTDGVMVESFTNAKPDSHGIVRQEQLKVRDFEDVSFFASSWWPGGGNRLYPRNGGAGDLANGFTGGTMIVLKHSDRDYTCYLAGVNDDIFSWFSTEDGTSFTLNTGTLGNKPYSGENKILYTVAEDSSLYGAIKRAWGAHKESEYNSTIFKFRDDKEYPEYFKYLGWCSWEGFKRNITAQKLIDVAHKIEATDIPVRYMLIDDGHQQQHEGDPWDYNTITRFGAMDNIFPNGYEELLNYRREDKIKWMGLWLAGLGGRDGIYPENTLPQEVQDELVMTHMKALLPNGSLKSAETFYDAYIGEHIIQPGWDFSKIDFQSRTLTHYAGGEAANYPIKNNEGAFANPFLAASNMAIALEKSLADGRKGVINCNALATFALFNLNNSVVNRCSEDYWVYDKGRARNHLHNSYATIPFMGQVVWGDHDMFHSCDSISGRMMAISKAISGGPVYLSDMPDHFVGDVIKPLCYSDGELLRPLAPAAPTEESFFTNAQTEAKIYTAFAPLKNRSVAVAAYNLYAKIDWNDAFYNALLKNRIPEEVVEALKSYGVTSMRNNDEYEVFLKEFGVKYPKLKKYMRSVKSVMFDVAGSAKASSTITADIYRDAPAMMQNGEASWEIPTEGVLCYDWNRRKAAVLGDGYHFTIDGFGDELYMLVPIENGWGIIGDATKYLSPAGYTLISSSEDQIIVDMREGGELIVWNASAKELKANGSKVTSLGDNLWQIDVEPTTERVVIN